MSALGDERETLPGLSVLLIARNSARYLDECLRSVAPVADEIVLVDTGSTDDTIAIARRHDCRVLDFAWCDDFSQARNFAIAQARRRWLLSIDTDEILMGQDAKAIIDRATASAAPAYLVHQDNLFDSGQTFPNPVARLFQNHPQIRFRNPVHECISESIRDHFPGYHLTLLPIRLRHLGYLSPNQAGKHERNFAILQKWVADAPDTLFGNFKLGNMLREAGRPTEALVHLDRAYALLHDPRVRQSAPYLEIFLHVYEQTLRAAGEDEAAARLAATARQWRSITPV